MPAPGTNSVPEFVAPKFSVLATIIMITISSPKYIPVPFPPILNPCLASVSLALYFCIPYCTATFSLIL